MKKSLVASLTTALVVGTAATTFAAANPFSDVPSGHWAYDSVTKLAAEGIIEGYGDGTYLGDRNITRYEMAQIIAKALAKHNDNAELQRLAAEFREELDNLGVRVSNLEKYSDKVTWHGKIEYTYHNRKGRGWLDGEKTTSNGYVFRLEPRAEINEHWSANARLDANGDMSTDSGDNEMHVKLKRAWAQADYDKFQAKIGRFEFYTNEHGLIWDTEISGAQVTFGSKWKGTIMGGRLAKSTVGTYTNLINPNSDKYGENESNLLGINVQYDPGETGLFGGLGYYHVKDHDFPMVYMNKTDEKANIWSVNLGYKFTPLFKITADYARNGKADFGKNSWQVELRYGNYDNAKERGQWAVWTGYRKFGLGTSLAGTTEDDILYGYKGWFIGGAYAPFKNIGLIFKYGDNRFADAGRIGMHAGDVKVKHIFGRVEFFF